MFSQHDRLHLILQHVIKCYQSVLFATYRCSGIRLRAAVCRLLQLHLSTTLPPLSLFYTIFWLVWTVICGFYDKDRVEGVGWLCI